MISGPARRPCCHTGCTAQLPQRTGVEATRAASLSCLPSQPPSQGLAFQELYRGLFDAVQGDKAGRQQLYGVLLRLFLYEELPADLVQQLAPLLQVRGYYALRSTCTLRRVQAGRSCGGSTPGEPDVA